MILQLSEILEYTGIVTSSVDYTTKVLPNLNAVVSESISEVESYCMRKLTSGSYTEYINGDGTNTIHLKNKNINSITSVQYYLTSGGTSSYVDILRSGDSVSNFVLILTDINQIKLQHNYIFPCGNKNIKIVYESGYTNSNLPSDLKTVLKEMAVLKYWNSPAIGGKSRLGLSSSNISIASSEGVSYKDESVKWDKVLDRYKLKG